MNLKSLGLAYRARKVVVGTDIVVLNMQQKNLYLILLAADASDNTKKKIYDKAKTYKIQVLEVPSTVILSQAIGKIGIKVVGITDKGFSKLLSK